MNLLNINQTLKNEPAFRIKQIKKAIFYNFINSWNETSNIPKKLIELLKENHSLEIKYQLFNTPKNKTKKALIELNDGLQIETVLLKHKDNRNTVCVSSQVGCPLACKFCATGDMGYKRNLTVDEIVEQILVFARLEKPSKITNIVFMGMGEPFLNYKNVIEAIKILNNPEYFNIGARKISISTAGIPSGIKDLKNEKLQINLAISLHAPNNNLRETLMPINKKYPLQKLFKSLDDYINQTGRKVMFEYLLIDKINDQEIHAKQLVKILNNPLYLVNLIPYNEINGKIYKASKPKSIEKFKNILRKNKVQFTERHYFGGEIKAACGQLTTKN
ncbi:23S rRNA (adenine(2503)-C(2))-methyltransferase RlmN [Candidatus Parcubacteria bacterium]|nr:23S rRNA (adenine(2503)-C(2))-methyltransferase RlmN [Candidatus Parcubacteria bacterium]